MPDSWETHQAAAASAITAVARAQEFIAITTEQLDVAMGAILEATGSTEVQSATNALDFIAGAKERVQEAYGMTSAAVFEIERYKGGF